MPPLIALLDYLNWSKDDLPMQNTQILNDDEQEMLPSSTMHEMIQITRCNFKKIQYRVQVQFQMLSICICIPIVMHFKHTRHISC
jgi:hypothetical protein